MIKRVIRLICLSVLFITSNSIAFAQIYSLPFPAGKNPSYAIPNVTSIVVNGNLNIRLVQARNGEQNHFQILEGAFPVQVTQLGNTLIFRDLPLKIKNKKGAPVPLLPMIPVTILLTLNQLNELQVNNNSSVFTKQFNAPQLQVVSNTSGSVELNGMIGLESLISHGSGPVNIHQIKAYELHVVGNGMSSINLQGTTRYLQVRLAGSDQLDTTGVASDIAFVQTKDQAQARVNVIRSLYAFASGQSIILYYSSPAAKVEFSSESGNVLRLEE